MNEEILFGAGLQDDGLFVGLEKLEGILGELDLLGKRVGESMVSGLGSAFDALANFDRIVRDEVVTVGDLATELGLLSVEEQRLVTQSEDLAAIFRAANDSTEMWTRELSVASDAVEGLLGRIGKSKGDFSSFNAVVYETAQEFSTLFPDALRLAERAVDSLAPKLYDTGRVLRDVKIEGVDISGSFGQLFPDAMHLAANAIEHVVGIIEDGGTQALRDLGFQVIEDTDRGNIFARALAFVRDQAEQLLPMLGSMAERLGLVGGAGERAGAGLLGMGERGREAHGMLGGLFGNIGEFIAVLAGFGIVNEAGRALHDFGNWAFEGNIQLERFRQQLSVLVGGAANDIVDWSFRFGRTIPFTTSSLQQAILTIASMRLNVQDVMPILATLASAMGTDLPNAATAFFDALKEHRFLMLMTNLRISKSDLQQFGLQVESGGKIVESTFLPALEKLAKTRFPTALTDAMHTFYGETSNLTDQVQQLAMAFGNPIFETFKGVLFDLTTYLQANHDQIAAVAEAIGGDFARALSLLATGLKDTLDFLLRHREVIAILVGLIGGGFISVVGGLLGALVDLIIGVSPLIGVFILVGGAIGGAVAAFKRAYDESPVLRGVLKDLEHAAGDLWNALKPLVEGALKQLGDGLHDAYVSASDWIKRPEIIKNIEDLATAMEHLSKWLTPVSDGAPLVGRGIKQIEQPAATTMPLVRDLAEFTKRLSDAMQSLAAPFAFVATIVGILASGGLERVVGFFWSLGRDLLGLPVDTLFGLGAALDEVAVGFADVTPAVLGFFDTLDIQIAAFAGWIMGPLAVAVTGLSDAIAALAPIIIPLLVIGAVVAGVVLAFQHLWQTSSQFRSVLSDLVSQVLGLWGVLQTSLKPAMDQLHDTIRTQLLPAWNSLKDAFEAAKPVLIFVGEVIIGVLVVGLGFVIAFLRGVIQSLGPFLAGLIQTFGGLIQFLSGIISFIVNLIMGFATIIYDIVTGHFDRIGKDVQKYMDGMGRALENIWNGIVNMASGIWKMLWDTIVGFVEGFYNGIIGWFTKLYDDLVGHSIIPDLINAIVDWFTGLPDKALGALGSLVDKVSGPFNDLISNARQWGAEIGQHLADGMRSMRDTVGNAASDIGSSISGFLHFSLPEEGPLHDVDRWMPDFADELIRGMDGQSSSLEDAANRMAIAIMRPLRGSNAGSITPDMAASLLGMRGSGGSLGLFGAALASASARSGTGGGPTEIHAHLHMEGDARFGLDMLDAVTRENVMRQMARDFATNMRLQGVLPGGYAASP